MHKIFALFLAILMSVACALPAQAVSSDYTSGYLAGYEDGFLKGLEFAGISAESLPDPSAIAPTAPREPVNGEILYGKNHPEGSEITVHASKTSSVVVLLKTKAGVPRLAFYVSKNNSVTIKVPSATLFIYFASGDGDDWCGYEKGKMFGPETIYTKDTKALDFTTYTYTYTLYPVTDGNFTEFPSDASEFF